MNINIKDERIIAVIIEVLEEELQGAKEELEKVTKQIEVFKFENEELYKENEKLVHQVEELKRDIQTKTAEADKLQKTEARLSEMTEKNIVAWEKIRQLENKNKELEELQKKTAKSVSQADMDFMRKANKELEDRIDELTRENLKLSRQAIKFKNGKEDPGAVVAELIKEIRKSEVTAKNK